MDFDLQLFATGDIGGAGAAAGDASGTGSDPAAGASGSDSGSSTGGASDSDDLSKKTAEELAIYARQLRGREAYARTKLADAERERNELRTTVDARNAKDLEEQKKFKELADIEKQKRVDTEQDRDEKLKVSDIRYIRAEVRAAAIKAGIVDPKDVNNFDVTDLRIDEDGNIVGVDEFVATQKTAKPHWFKQEQQSDQSDVGSGKDGTPPPLRGNQGSDNEKRDWRKASPADITSELNRMMGTRH